MSGKPKPDPKPATQRTPKGHEIPVPERDAVIRDLMKVAPREPSAPGDSPENPDSKP